MMPTPIDRPSARTTAATRIALIAMALVATPAAAVAHGIQLWVYADDGQLVIDAEYGEDDPVVDGQVTIVGPNGELIADGKTNAKGRFTLAVDEEALARYESLQIVVDAGLGHRGKKTLQASELREKFATAASTGAGEVRQASDQEKNHAKQERSHASLEPPADDADEDTDPSANPEQSAAIDRETQEEEQQLLAEIHEQIAKTNRILDEQGHRVSGLELQTAQIAQLRRQLMIARIIAGLGIILGLTGLAAFWLSRHDRRRTDLRQPPSV